MKALESRAVPAETLESLNLVGDMAKTSLRALLLQRWLHHISSTPLNPTETNVTHVAIQNLCPLLRANQDLEAFYGEADADYVGTTL